MESQAIMPVTLQCIAWFGTARTVRPCSGRPTQTGLRFSLGARTVGCCCCCSVPDAPETEACFGAAFAALRAPFRLRYRARDRWPFLKAGGHLSPVRLATASTNAIMASIPYIATVIIIIATPAPCHHHPPIYLRIRASQPNSPPTHRLAKWSQTQIVSRYTGGGLTLFSAVRVRSGHRPWQRRWQRWHNSGTQAGRFSDDALFFFFSFSSLSNTLHCLSLFRLSSV